jgi:hypothetical protein
VLVVKNQQLVNGELNAYNGVGLKGTFTLSSAGSDAGHSLLYELYDAGFLKMQIPPDHPLIDGANNALAVRQCGVIRIIKSAGNIDDAPHTQWSVLLQRLQAQILSQQWVQVSPRAFEQTGFSSWFYEAGIRQTLEP